MCVCMGAGATMFFVRVEGARAFASARRCRLRVRKSTWAFGVCDERATHKHMNYCFLVGALPLKECVAAASTHTWRMLDRGACARATLACARVLPPLIAEDFVKLTHTLSLARRCLISLQKGLDKFRSASFCQRSLTFVNRAPALHNPAHFENRGQHTQSDFRLPP